MEALQNYLSLQAMRFEGIFEYHIEGYEGFEEDEIMIPPMLIQPFVENANSTAYRTSMKKAILSSGSVSNT